MRGSAAVWAGVAGMVLGAVACSGPDREPMADGARTYLEGVLDLMERESLLRYEADWAAVRGAAVRRAEQDRAQTTAQTYPAIREALRELGERHSTFLDPGAPHDETPEPAAELPVVDLLPDRIAHVTLPSVPDEQAGAEYVRTGRDAVARAAARGACGWVVDLRFNPGGDMFPLLAAVGAVLGDGTVGSFVTPDGKRTPWVVRNGTPAEQLPTWGPARPLPRPAPPVAVLTSDRTASAAEAAAIAFRGRPDTRSFGETTRGLTTANEAHRLPDGAMLLLAGAHEADRTGRIHRGPLTPDEQLDEERALPAATKWLSTRPACRP